MMKSAILSTILVLIVATAQGLNYNVNIPNAEDIQNAISGAAANINNNLANAFGGDGFTGDIEESIENMFNGIGDTVIGDATGDAVESIKNIFNEVASEDNDGDDNDDITTLEEFINAIGGYDGYEQYGDTTDGELDNVDLEEFVKNWDTETEENKEEQATDLVCYHCTSDDNLNCKNKDKLEDEFLKKCPANEGFCQTLTMKTGTGNNDEVMVMRKCGSEDLNVNMDCKNQNITNCVAYVSCSTDGCNDASVDVNSSGKLTINHAVSVFGLFFAILLIR